MPKKTFVLVHGYLGGSRQWTKQVNFFSKWFNVITPDLLGFGLKTNLNAPSSIREFAQNILDEISVLEINDFYLLGHSMGGMIAQEMVKIAPERIKKLILYSTGSVGLLPGRFETIEESKRKVQKYGVIDVGKKTVATWFVNKEKAKNYLVCAHLVDKVSKQASIAGLDAMQSWSGKQNLAKINKSTLILWGDKDLTYTWQQINTMWQSIPNASLAVIPDCAHAVHLEKPDIFNTIVLDFLKL